MTVSAGLGGAEPVALSGRAAAGRVGGGLGSPGGHRSRVKPSCRLALGQGDVEAGFVELAGEAGGDACPPGPVEVVGAKVGIDDTSAEHPVGGCEGICLYGAFQSQADFTSPISYTVVRERLLVARRPTVIG